MVVIELTWSHWKILRFGQVMGQGFSKNTNYSRYGHTFFGHNSAILWPTGLNVFVELGKLLSMDCWWELNVMLLSFWFRIFGPLLAGKRAWPPRRLLRVWGLKTENLTKNLAHVRFLLVNLLSQNHIPKVSDLGPP